MQSYRSPVLLQGMGGMGKSELMSYWIHQASNQKIARLKYQNIIYVNCSNDIETGFLTNSNVLEQLGISNQIEDKDTDKLSVITAALNQLEHLLLVLDDLPWHEPALTNCNAQLAYLKTLPCQIIATSRSQDYQQFRPININSLSEDECINLFSKYSKVADIENDSIIKEIINLAGSHTLTIELLAKTAYRQQYTLAELLEKLHTNKFNINTKIRYDKDLNSAYEDIDTALGKLFAISGLTEQQQKILYHLSLMDSQETSFDILAKWLAIVHIKDKSMLTDLVSSGWLQNASIKNDNIKYYSLHRVVSHAFITHFCSIYAGDERTIFFQSVINNIKQHYSQFDTYKIIQTKISENLLQKQRLDQACLPAAASYLVQSVCLTKDVKQQEVFIIALNNFIVFCDQQGIYSLGIKTLSNCVDRIQNSLGAYNLNYANILNNLASLYVSIGDYEKALPLYDHSHSIVISILDERHPNFADSLNNLAYCNMLMENFEEAQSIYKTVIKLTNTYRGENHSDSARAYNNLAGLYVRIEKYSEALPLSLKAESIANIELGKLHPNYASCISILANIHTGMKNYELALPIYQEAIEIRRIKLGIEHPEYAFGLYNLAILFMYMSNYAKALPLYEEAIAIVEKSLGKDNSHSQAMRKDYDKVMQLINNNDSIH